MEARDTMDDQEVRGGPAATDAVDSARDLREVWEGLCVLGDWLGGGLRRPGPEPDFEALAASWQAASAPVAGASGAGTSAAGGVPGAALAALEAAVAACAACPNGAAAPGRAPGAGVARPLVLVVGDVPLAPGGEAEALLEKMLAAIGVSVSHNAYLTSLLKCPPAPGGGREALRACRPHLEAQVAALGPRAILCLGEAASQALTGSRSSMAELRGAWSSYAGIPLLATYHPRDLLEDGSRKRPAWEDLKALKEGLGDALR